MKNVYIQVSLKCPDNLIESLGFDIPKDLDKFIKFINDFSEEKDYTIKIKRTYPLEQLAQLKNGMKI